MTADHYAGYDGDNATPDPVCESCGSDLRADEPSPCDDCLRATPCAVCLTQVGELEPAFDGLGRPICADCYVALCIGVE